MQIKSFSAPKLHEALAQVRQTLGADAVILDRLESKDEQGQTFWHVHAALDTDLGDTKPQHIIPPHLEASLSRLEKIAVNLGNRDAEQYRQAIIKPSIRDAFDHLLDIGVSAVNAFEMAEDYAQQKPMNMQTLFWSQRIQPQQQREVLLFSGASGAGKTLLIAKLATHYSLKGVSVALITTDANRMGGSDVLRAYAAVLGVPFFEVRHGEEARAAAKATKTAQLVLIDSEGWNNRHAAGLRKQAELWQLLASTHRILLMPASMDESDGLSMFKRAHDLGMTDIAFSKLDETSRPGKIINWAEASRMPMSYCSFGPEVPNQMGWLTPKALTAILIKQYRQQQDEQEEEMMA